MSFVITIERIITDIRRETRIGAMVSAGPRYRTFLPILQALALIHLRMPLECHARSFYSSQSTQARSLGDGENQITTIIKQESSSIDGSPMVPKTKLVKIVETSKSSSQDYPVSNTVMTSTSEGDVLDLDSFVDNLSNMGGGSFRSAGGSANGSPYRNDAWIADNYYSNSNPYARDIAKLLRIKQGHYADLYQQMDSPSRQPESSLQSFENTVSSVVQQLGRDISGTNNNQQASVKANNY